MYKQLIKFLFKPVDIASLVFFRFAFGLILSWEVVRYFKKGWIYEFFIEPKFFFSYYGLTVHPLFAEGMYALFMLMGLAALCIAIGYHYRIASFFFFCSFTYIFLIDQTNYLNHFYLIILLSLAMIFIPAHCAVSVDVAQQRVKHSDYLPCWCIFLLCFIIGLPYFFGGVSKLNTDWLQGEPMRTYLYYSSDFPVIGKYFKHEYAGLFFSYGGLLVDFMMLPLLLVRQTRAFAFLIAVSFHSFNYLFFDIGIFPLLMVCATTLFFSPDWPRFKGILFPVKSNIKPEFGAKKIVICSLSVFILLQLLLPFRHFFYEGNVNWTEEGRYFAWNMMSREKQGKVFFRVKKASKKRSENIKLNDYLNPKQIIQLHTKPDMIRQFARFLAKEYHENGYPEARVEVQAVSSMHRRPMQKIINPEVDLTKISYSLRKSDWIVPLE